MIKTIPLYLALGSNLGDRKEYLLFAIRNLDAMLGTRHAACSRFMETAPEGFQSEDLFLNAAVLYKIPDAGQDPALFCRSVLAICKEIEAQAGRSPQAPRYDVAGNRIYTSRPLDIDVLLYGDFRMDTTELTIPHARMARRAFVMTPLREIVEEQTCMAFPAIFVNSPTLQE